MLKKSDLKLGKKELVGYITVDAGLVQLGDPCYDINSMNQIDFDAPNNGVYDIEEGKAITVQTAFGDGLFPVYIRRDRLGGIMEMTVNFNPFK